MDLKVCQFEQLARHGGQAAQGDLNPSHAGKIASFPFYMFVEFLRLNMTICPYETASF